MSNPTRRLGMNYKMSGSKGRIRVYWMQLTVTFGRCAVRVGRIVMRDCWGYRHEVNSTRQDNKPGFQYGAHPEIASRFRRHSLDVVRQDIYRRKRADLKGNLCCTSDICRQKLLHSMADYKMHGRLFCAGALPQ